MRGDRAPDLICRQGRPLFVGLGEDDREVRWSVGVEKPHGVSVADGLAEPFGHLPQQSFDLYLLQLFVDVLCVVELDQKNRERPVVAHGAVGLLADQRVDELRVPDPGRRVDDPKQRTGGPVGLAVAAAGAILRGLRNLRAAVPAGSHGGEF